MHFRVAKSSPYKKFFIQRIRPVPHRLIDLFFIRILLLFNIMLTDISFFVFMLNMLNMFMKVFCNGTEQNRTKLLFAIKLRPHAGGI